MRRVITVLGVAASVLAGGAVGAQETPCDFATGGGFIITTADGTHNAARANFGVGGSCKTGGDGHGLWGHLEYIDHGFVTPDNKKLNIHWTTITGYFFCGDLACTSFVDPPGQPTGTRLICGTARTNLTSPDETVDWAVKVTDNTEPGKNSDTFMIKVVGGSLSYSSGDQTLAGGNIQLHKPNNSGFFGTPTDNCPAFVPPPSGQCTPDSDCVAPQECNLVTNSCCPLFAPHFNPSTGECEGID